MAHSGGGSFLVFFCFHFSGFRAAGGKKARQEATARKDRNEGRNEGGRKGRKEGSTEGGTALWFTAALETLAGTFC